MATRSPTRIMRKLAGYFDSVWNRYDLLMNIMFIITIILRYTLTGDNFIWARTFYSLTMAMHYLRLMQFFYVEKNVGPKVIMIRRMVRNNYSCAFILYQNKTPLIFSKWNTWIASLRNTTYINPTYII